MTEDIRATQTPMTATEVLLRETIARLRYILNKIADDPEVPEHIYHIAKKGLGE